VRRLGLLADRRLAALLAAEVVSTTGSQMIWLALPWFVLVTTGSPARKGFVAAAEVAGAALFGLPGGSLLARLGARPELLGEEEHVGGRANALLLPSAHGGRDPCSPPSRRRRP